MGRRHLPQPTVIEHEGRPTHAVIPWAEWVRLRALVEDREGIANAERILADPSAEWVPTALADRMLDGEHPVKVWREHRGLTQVQLAAAAGLQQPTVARIEGGKRRGTVEQLAKLAGALGIRLDTLAATMERRT